MPILLLLPLLVPPAQAMAQRDAPTTFPSFEARWTDPRAAGPNGAGVRVGKDGEGSGGDLVFPSLIGGLGTFWVTAYIGSQLHGTPCEDCGLVEGLYGAAVGFGLGAAAGAHLANGREGSFGKAALVGMAIGVAGTLAAIETDEWRLLLAVPIAQIASAITIEREPRRE